MGLDFWINSKVQVTRGTCVRWRLRLRTEISQELHRLLWLWQGWSQYGGIHVKTFHLDQRVTLMHFLVITIFLYACESWTLTPEIKKRIQVFKMRCDRRLLNILYKDHVTNEDVGKKIQAALGEYDKLLTLIKKRKLRYSGHIARSSSLAKTILQGTSERKRKTR